MSHSLEELEHLAKEATPGVWVVSCKRGNDWGHTIKPEGSLPVANVKGLNTRANAAFIAAARQAIPDLIQRVRELEAQIASMEKRDE